MRYQQHARTIKTLCNPYHYFVIDFQAIMQDSCRASCKVEHASAKLLPRRDATQEFLVRVIKSPFIYCLPQEPI